MPHSHEALVPSANIQRALLGKPAVAPGGRAGVYELLVTDTEIRRLCTSGASSGTIREHALKAGMQTLRQSGYQRVLRGETTLEEVQRITRGDVG